MGFAVNKVTLWWWWWWLKFLFSSLIGSYENRTETNFFFKWQFRCRNTYVHVRSEIICHYWKQYILKTRSIKNIPIWSILPNLYLNSNIANISICEGRLFQTYKSVYRVFWLTHRGPHPSRFTGQHSLWSCSCIFACIIHII